MQNAVTLRRWGNRPRRAAHPRRRATFPTAAGRDVSGGVRYRVTPDTHPRIHVHRALRLHSFALVAALLVSACGGRQIPPPIDAYDDPVDVFEATLERLLLLTSLRATVTADIRGQMGRASVEQIVLARAPSELRVEAISPYDTTLSVFLIRQDRITFYDLQEQIWVTGVATPANIAQFIPFWMSPEDLVRVLFGGPPLDAVVSDVDAYRMNWDTRTGTYRLRLPVEAGGEVILRVEHGTWTVRSAHRFDADGTLMYEFRTGDVQPFALEDGVVHMPQRLRFLMEREALDITLEVERMDVNVDLADMLFDLDQPAGASARELE